MTTIDVKPNLADLERALGALWQQVRSKIDGDQPLTRALTLNLIVVTDNDRERDLRETIDRFLRRHPCRVFLLSVDESSIELTATLSAQTLEQRNCCQMILEQLTITTHPADFPRLPSLIRPLLVEDVPVHLFWARPLPKNIWNLDALAELANRVVLDAALLGDGDLPRLPQLRQWPITHLDALRVRPWRRAIAEAFEQIDFDAERITSVRIEHADNLGATSTCHLLADWIKQRLGDQCHTQLQHGTESAWPPLQPAKVEIAHGPHQIEIVHLLDEPVLRSVVTSNGTCRLPTHLRASSGHRGDLLGAAVEI